MLRPVAPIRKIAGGPHSPRHLLPVFVLTLLAPLGTAAQPLHRESIEPQKYVFLLEYVSSDYDRAVRAGEVVSEFEYREMLDLSALLVDHFDDMRRLGASEEISDGLLELRRRIGARGAPSDVRALGAELADRLATELEIRSLPAAPPDPRRARELFEPNCTPCHGKTGHGDGPSSPGMNPKPASFHDPRMGLLSPYQVYGAITYGVPGTAMPSFRFAFGSDEIWDLAFLVMGLREEEEAPGPRFVGPTETRDFANGGVGALVESLQNDPDPRIRRWAAWTLGRTGAIGPATTDALLGGLRDDDEMVREYSAAALVRFGAVIAPRLTEAIAVDSTARPHAEKLLIEIGRPAVPEVVRLLEQGPSEARSSAVHILTEIGREAESAVPYLVEALRRTTSLARGVKLAVALGRIGTPSLTPLLELLEGAESPMVRELACRGLGLIGSDAVDAAPALLNALDDPNVRIRFTAASALGDIRYTAAVSKLVDRVSNDTNRTVRVRSIEALGKLGPDAEAAVPLLVEVLGSEDESLAGHAARSLAEIGDAAFSGVANALQNGSSRTRSFAAHALGWMDLNPALRIPLLVALLGDEDQRVRDTATVVLAGLGGPAVPYLGTTLTGDANWRARGNAALALGRMAPPSADGVAALTAALDDGNETVRQLACWSLGVFGEMAAPAVTKLTSVALESPEFRLRRLAVWAIGNIGPAAASAEPALKALLDDPKVPVRTEAEEALQKLRGTYDYGAATGEKR